jgi:hypothetical protein
MQLPEQHWYMSFRNTQGQRGLYLVTASGRTSYNQCFVICAARSELRHACACSRGMYDMAMCPVGVVTATCGLLLCVRQQPVARCKCATRVSLLNMWGMSN